MSLVVSRNKRQTPVHNLSDPTVLLFLKVFATSNIMGSIEDNGIRFVITSQEVWTLLQKPFSPEEFPAPLGPKPFLGLALLSQTGMSFVQQGLVVLGIFFVSAYHLNLTQLGFVTSSLSLGIMISMVFIGLAVDRVGPRFVLTWGTLLMTGLSALLFNVHSYSWLLGILFLLGISLASVPSAGTKAVFTAFAGRPRGLVMGIRQSGVPMGAAIAALLLPRFVTQFGLDPVFGLFAVELLICGWAFAAVIRPVNRIASTAEHVHLGHRHWIQLLQPLTVAFLMVSGQYILLTYTMTFLHQIHHLTLVRAGQMLALSQISGGLGRVILGQVSDRLGGRRPPVLAFAATLGATLAFIVGILPDTVPVWLVFGVWTLFGFGAVGWNALALTWAGESVPPSHSGFAMSLTGTIIFLGASISPPVFGFLVDTTHHFVYGWWMLSGILTLAAIISWVAMVKQEG